MFNVLVKNSHVHCAVCGHSLGQYWLEADFVWIGEFRIVRVDSFAFAGVCASMRDYDMDHGHSYFTVSLESEVKDSPVKTSMVSYRGGVPYSKLCPYSVPGINFVSNSNATQSINNQPQDNVLPDDREFFQLLDRYLEDEPSSSTGAYSRDSIHRVINKIFKEKERKNIDVIGRNKLESNASFGVIGDSCLTCDVLTPVNRDISTSMTDLHLFNDASTSTGDLCMTSDASTSTSDLLMDGDASTCVNILVLVKCSLFFDLLCFFR